MQSKQTEAHVHTPTNSSKEIYQALMKELQSIVSKLSPIFSTPNSSTTQSSTADENKFIAFATYETQLETLRNRPKHQLRLELPEGIVDYTYHNLHVMNQTNIQRLSETKQFIQNKGAKQKEKYLEELTNHCVYLSLEEKETKTSKSFKFHKSEFQQAIFSVFHELFLLSQERNDLYSVKKFAEAFLVNHFWRENKISDDYLAISFHYTKNILIHLYFGNKNVISQAQESVAEDLISIAKRSYDHLLNSLSNVNNNSAEMMTELAIFQAIYLYHYELTLHEKSSLTLNRSILVSGEEKFSSSFKLKDNNEYNGKNIKKYLLNNNKIMALLKQAFRHCKNSSNLSPNTTRTQMSLIIEFFVKTCGDALTAIYQSNELKYDDKRAYYNSIKANFYILKDMLAFTEMKNINCFQDNSIKTKIKNLEKYLETFIITSDKEFEKQVVQKKLAEKSLLKEKKPNKKKSKKTIAPTTDDKQDLPGPSTTPTEPANNNNSTSNPLTYNNQASYNDALLLLIKKEYIPALKSFDVIKNNTKRKEMDLKIKAIVSMAECHIEIAKIMLKKKILTYCFNHKKPVSAEIRNEIMQIMDHIKQALICCEEAKQLTPKLPIEDRTLFFGCIELVSLSALNAAEDLEKERNSYLKNMDFLKSILIKKGLYGEGVTSDPHHIVARGVEWCANCEMAILNITDLASDFKQNTETSYNNDEDAQLQQAISGKAEKTEELFSNLTQNLHKMEADSEDIKKSHELKALEELQELLINLGNPYAQNRNLIFSNKNKNPEGSTAIKSLDTSCPH